MKSKLLLFLLLPLVMAAQNRKAVKGQIMAGASGVKDVLVINNNAQLETRTDSLGFFTIKAAARDLFVITDYKIETKKVRYTQDQVKNNIFVINVTLVATELEEVVINKRNITAESLGLVPKDQKKYTVAERRLRAEYGMHFDVDSYLERYAGDAAYKLSERKRALLRNILTERKLTIITKVQVLYTDEQMVSFFKIPESDIGYFLYYIAEDEDMVKASDTNNTNMIRFLITGIAVKYNTVINNNE